VLGANCYTCSLPVCVDEECSVFYKHVYCTNCVCRDKDFFSTRAAFEHFETKSLFNCFDMIYQYDEEFYIVNYIFFIFMLSSRFLYIYIFFYIAPFVLHVSFVP